MNIVCGCNVRVGYEPVHLHLLWVGGNVRLATGTGSATDWVSRLCVALSRAVRTTDRMHTCRCLVPCLVVDVAGLVSPCDDRTSPGRRSCDLVGSPSLACYKTRAGSRVTSSAGSSGRQTSCRLDATCICEFNDVLNVRLEWEFDVVWRRRIISENISENGKGRRWPSVTLLGHAIAVVTASEVVSSRGLIACARASVGDTRYAWCILFVLSGATWYSWPGRLFGRLLRQRRGQLDYLAVYWCRGVAR